MAGALRLVSDWLRSSAAPRNVPVREQVFGGHPPTCHGPHDARHFLACFSFASSALDLGVPVALRASLESPSFTLHGGSLSVLLPARCCAPASPFAPSRLAAPLQPSRTMVDAPRRPGALPFREAAEARSGVRRSDLTNARSVSFPDYRDLISSYSTQQNTAAAI